MSSSWKNFFYDSTILWMYRARNAKNRVVMPTNFSGKFQLEARDFATGFHYQLTNRPQGALFGSISPNGEYIFFLEDKKGNETGHFFRIPFCGGKKVDITPDLPLYFSYGVSVNNLGDRLCFHASIENKNKVYLVNFDNKNNPLEPKLIYETENSILSSIISPDGLYTCISSTIGNKHDTSEVTVFNNDNCEVVSRKEITGGTFVAQAFSSDFKKTLILGVSNASGYSRPVFFDFLKNNINEINNENFSGNISILEWFEDNNKLLLGQEYQARNKLFLYDLNDKSIKFVGPVYGSFDLFFGSTASLVDSSLLLRWQSFNNSPRIIQLNKPDYNKIIEIDNSTETNKKKFNFESINFNSYDGVSVQMWVAKPSDNKKTCPFIIDIHGGPHGSVGDNYSPGTQIWLEQGFGYCAVNYRGSTSFGKSFEEAIYGDPGNLETEDMVAARNWLVENGLADPNKIVLFGWSWGGYVTLLASGKYPDLWAGGIAGTPIADFVMQYEDEPAFFQAIDQKRFGGTPPERPEVYKKSSPINYADNFKKPILVIYGKNDIRCTSRQIMNFIEILKNKKKPIKVKVFVSGHAGVFSDTKIRISNFNEALNFAKKIIKKNLPKSTI